MSTTKDTKYHEGIRPKDLLRVTLCPSWLMVLCLGEPSQRFELRHRARRQRRPQRHNLPRPLRHRL